jgi:hypothetical protein
MRSVAAIAPVFLLAAAAFGRTWTDHQGRQVGAELVKVNVDTVTLRRSADGKLFNLPLELFSDADQAYVAQSLRPAAIDEAEIMQQIGLAEPCGQGCGGTIFEGKPAGAFSNYYRINVPGFREKQDVYLSFIQGRERGNFLHQFVGPGFVYELKDGRFAFKVRDAGPR